MISFVDKLYIYIYLIQKILTDKAYIYSIIFLDKGARKK